MTTNRSGRPNRVAPDGSLHAVPARGTMWGNRGPLLDARGDLARHSRGRSWVCCVLDFHGRHREQWRPGRLTELYFLDEVTALAAGHRPCGECRHADYSRFRTVWSGLFPDDRGAAAIDRHLHDARLDGDRHRTYEAPLDALPDGTFVEHAGSFWLVRADHLLEWTFDGYRSARRRDTLPRSVTVCTPAPLVDVLRAGFVAGRHASAATFD